MNRNHERRHRNWHIAGGKCGRRKSNISMTKLQLWAKDECDAILQIVNRF